MDVPVILRGKENRGLQMLHCKSDQLLDRVVQLMNHICKLFSRRFCAMDGVWLLKKCVERVFGQLAGASTTIIQPSASQDKIFYVLFTFVLKSCLHS